MLPYLAASGHNYEVLSLVPAEHGTTIGGTFLSAMNAWYDGANLSGEGFLLIGSSNKY